MGLTHFSVETYVGGIKTQAHFENETRHKVTSTLSNEEHLDVIHFQDCIKWSKVTGHQIKYSTTFACGVWDGVSTFWHH